MQTHFLRAHGIGNTLRTVVLSLVSMVLVIIMCSGCSAPRVEGRAESESQQTTCDKFYARATQHDVQASKAPHMIMRYYAANEAQHDWLDVAIQCPNRFTEGTIRSVQMQLATKDLAQSLGQEYTSLSISRLDGIDSIAVSGKSLATMALAEDRAGFATEVLAGKYASTAPKIRNTNIQELAQNNASGMLRVSNNHKETASQLMNAAQNDSNIQDLRRKVYATQELTAHPNTIVDPATGIQAPTYAVIEMDCAREELAAFEPATPSSTRGLLHLSMLIGTHIINAIEAGYPSNSEAIFKQ